MNEKEIHTEMIEEAYIDEMGNDTIQPVSIESTEESAPSSPVKAKKNRKKPLMITSAILIVIAIGYFSLAFFDKNAVVQSAEIFEVQSVVEMDEVGLAAQVSGEIKEIYVMQGDVVARGQLIAVIDNEALLIKKAQAEAGIATIQGQINGAQASIAAAEAQLGKVQEGARQEEIDQDQSRYEMAEASFQRSEVLYQQDAISLAEYETAVSNRDIAKAQYEITLNSVKENDVKAAQANLDGAYASVEAYDGQLKSAQSSLAEIEMQLRKTQIYAPADGIISNLNYKPGELISSGAKIAAIVDDAKPWIECSVRETDLDKVQVGQTVKLRFGAYEGQEFEGSVVSVNKHADFATKKATNESGSFDIKAYKVKVEINEHDVALYAGMTAFVRF